MTGVTGSLFTAVKTGKGLGGLRCRISLVGHKRRTDVTDDMSGQPRIATELEDAPREEAVQNRQTEVFSTTE
jgi:hypothetical protein